MKSKLVAVLCALVISLPPVAAAVMAYGAVDKLAQTPPEADETLIVVRPTELDVKGHVNNAKFVEYLQWARWDWCDARGLTNERLVGFKNLLVVVNLNVDYRREARQGERLRATLGVSAVGEKSLTFAQVIENAEGEVVATASVKMVAVDPSTRRSTPLAAELRAVLEREAARRRGADE